MREISITKGKVALVDDDDYEELSKHKWHTLVRPTTVYALGKILVGGKRIQMLMHRLIMKTPEGMETDHINGNGLDNRKENLRICTRSENQRNRKIHREGKLAGVYTIKYKDSIYYQAEILRNGKKIYIGRYPNEKLAHEAFMKMVEKLDKS